MRLITLLVIVALLIAACLLFRNHIIDRFTGSDALQLTWTPSGPNPANIGYNWGACISQGGVRSSSNCANQAPAYPPGPPGPGWTYKGQTPQGQNTLILNSSNCGDCQFGQVLTLLLQAVDLVNPSHPTSSWTAFTIDLTSKSSAVKTSITDATAPSEPLYPGSTGFIFTLQLNQPAFVQGNVANVFAQLVRGGTQYFSFSSRVPFTSISPDSTTGTFQGSFTSTSSSSPWNATPGALQSGDVLTVYSLVYNPGSAQQDGAVLFAGSLSQTASTITPTAPTGMMFQIS
jgi:hypothetical protein